MDFPTLRTNRIRPNLRQAAASTGAAPKDAARQCGKSRDYRLDFWRGVALIVIYIDHIPNNPLSHWTLRSFSFCDAAEVFVLISGISTYLAYSSKLERGGMRGLAGVVGRRWIRIYAAHVLLLLALASTLLTASWLFSRPGYEHALRMNWLFQDPAAAIPAALTLQYLPNYLDILPLYLVLLAAAPAIIWIVKRDVRIALALSVAIYAAARWTGFNLPAGNSGETWNFNPLTWQLIYMIGISAAHIRKEFRMTPAPILRRLAIAGSLAFVAFAFVMAAPWRGPDAGLSLFGPGYQLWPADKAMLSPLRVIDILALFCLTACFIAPQARWLTSRVAAPMLSCGRHSLPVFGFGVWMTVAGFVALNQAGLATSALIAANLTGIAGLIAIAQTLDWKSRVRTAAAIPMAVATPARRAA